MLHCHDHILRAGDEIHSPAHSFYDFSWDHPVCDTSRFIHFHRTQHGEIVTVAGHRARLAEENGALNLVYVRGDDVVVHVFGLGVSADDLVGVAEGLQPVIG